MGVGGKRLNKSEELLCRNTHRIVIFLKFGTNFFNYLKILPGNKQLHIKYFQKIETGQKS